MNKITKLFLIAIIYTILFNVPIFYLKYSIGNFLITDFVMEMAVIVPVTIVLFFILTIIPYIGTLLISTFFVVGIISGFFIYNFKKGFDEGVLHDLLSVETDLIIEYLNLGIVISVILGFLLIYYLLSKTLGSSRYRENKKYSAAILGICILISSLISKGFTNRSTNYTLINYVPYNIIWSIKQYNKKYKQQLEKLNNKIDLSKKYSFEFDSQDDTPLTIVMIIGESMRGSTVSQKNMPLIHKRKNVVFFKNAISSETSTREALPYMLTSAKSPNIEQSLTEKSFISIFKNLGFETSWIANQGIFGIFETSFASIALEADYVITKLELQKVFPNDQITDDYLIPFIDHRLQSYKRNSLTVMHLMGSHWRFDQRLPKDFEAPFTPECKNSVPNNCSQEQLMNSYENSFYYTDIVIDKLLKKLEHKNALVIYSSDHGLSLGENGFFGNASKDALAKKEQTDIAMFMWFSRHFIEKNPGILEKVKKHSKNLVSQDYIFHSILGCAGVKSTYIDPSLSFCK